MKKIIFNFFFIIPLLVFSFQDSDLINYFTSHPNEEINCYWSEHIYFLEGFSCEIFYRNNSYHLLFSNRYRGNTISSQIEFINTGTVDKPNFQIIYQDEFYDEKSNSYKHFFYENSRIIFIDNDERTVSFLIRYAQGANEHLEEQYHSNFYFYKHEFFRSEPSTFSLKKIITSKSLEFYKAFDSSNFSSEIPTLKLDKIKSIYQMALKEQHCFKSPFGCLYKMIALFDTIVIQNPDIPKPLVMITDIILHNISDYKIIGHIKYHEERFKSYPSAIMKIWKSHVVLIYRASDDKKIYVLDPYFLEDGVIEYDQWLLEYLKAKNDFTVELYQRLD